MRKQKCIITLFICQGNFVYLIIDFKIRRIQFFCHIFNHTSKLKFNIIENHVDI